MLEELLIDFRELVGAHSGANMAEAVWETITLYGLEGRVSNDVIYMQLFTFQPIIDHRHQRRQRIKQ